jgi:hypothetical protein
VALRLSHLFRESASARRPRSSRAHPFAFADLSPVPRALEATRASPRGALTTTQGAFGGTDPVRCNLGRIASGGQVTVTARVTPTAPGTIANQAWVAAKEDRSECGGTTCSPKKAR